jgi:DNA polymerase-3 subunit beta
MLLNKVDKDTLLKPLQVVIGVVERKQAIPILSNVLIEYADGALSFTASDADIQITTSTEAQLEGSEQSTTISAKKLQDILRILPDGTLITLETSDNKALLKARKSRFNLQTLPAVDFPKLDTHLLTEAETITLPQKQLKQLLSSVRFAMAQKDVRYPLNGMLMVIEGNELKSVAIDSARLAFDMCIVDNEFEKKDLILPRKAIGELAKLLSDSEDPVELTFTGQQLKASFSGITLITKILDGHIPDYQRVIPHYDSKITLNRPTLQQALKRAARWSNKKGCCVRFILNNNTLSIISNNSEQEEAHEELDISYEGPNLEIGFNINYIMDGLNNIIGETVDFSFGDANSCVLITTQADEAFGYVVMPMRI